MHPSPQNPATKREAGKTFATISKDQTPHLDFPSPNSSRHDGQHISSERCAPDEETFHDHQAFNDEGDSVQPIFPSVVKTKENFRNTDSDLYAGALAKPSVSGWRAALITLVAKEWLQPAYDIEAYIISIGPVASSTGPTRLLTTKQISRIAANRLKAIEIRKAKQLKEAEQQAKENESSSDETKEELQQTRRDLIQKGKAVGLNKTELAPFSAMIEGISSTDEGTIPKKNKTMLRKRKPARKGESQRKEGNINTDQASFGANKAIDNTWDKGTNDKPAGIADIFAITGPAASGYRAASGLGAPTMRTQGAPDETAADRDTPDFGTTA